ncbi:MAG: FeoB-associated Cys-rich membrane protein [Cyclobacteriaceae bacterium]
MAFNKFRNFPLYAKGIIFIYTLGFLTMMIYHIGTVIQYGFFARDISMPVNIWYDALGFLIVPATIILLYARPTTGINTAMVVMLITFTIDALVRFIIQDDSYANWFYYFEIVFAIVVLATYPFMRYMIKSKKSGKQYA